MKGLMVVGLDNNRDTSKKGKCSVGAVVASTNHYLTKYYSKCTFPNTPEEQMEQTAHCIVGMYFET